MAAITVVEVVNANTLRASPAWKWGEKKGTLIRVEGLPDCENTHCANCPTITGLNLMVLNSKVEVRRIHGIEEDALRCELHYKGRNLACHALKCQVLQCPDRVYQSASITPV